MKTTLPIVKLILVTSFTFITNANAGAIGERDRDLTRKPTLTEVKLLGTLRCEGEETALKHSSNHECNLEFVDDETGETWSVKDNPTLTSIHQSNNKEAKVHIDALRSPRYLLGGSFVEIKKIEALPTANANEDGNAERNPKLTHVCSLDTK